MALETVDVGASARLVSPEPREEDFDAEATLRPKTLEAVSYTHLDVYKRQNWGSPLLTSASTRTAKPATPCTPRLFTVANTGTPPLCVFGISIPPCRVHGKQFRKPGAHRRGEPGMKTGALPPFAR